MIRFLVILAALAAFASGALAQAPLDRIRNLLDRGDVQGLETEIASLHEKARARQDGSDLRKIYLRLFNTTHPERLATVERWLETMPTSTYAISAAAWGAIKKVEMYGGRDYESPGAPAGRLEVFASATRRAHDLVDRALSRSADFVPTLDAWMISRKFLLKRQKKSIFNPAIYAAVMKAAPDRASVLRIIETVDTSSANPTHDMLEACLLFGNIPEDYDSDLCMTEAALRHYFDRDVRDQAELALKEYDQRFLDDLRLDRMMYERGFWSRDRSEDLRARLLDLHAGSLNRVEDLETYRQAGVRIAIFLDDETYIDQSNARLFAFIDERLGDNPYDRILLQAKAETLLDAYTQFHRFEDLEEARALWPDMVKFGRYRSGFWRLGAALSGADRQTYEVERELPYLENSIAYERQAFGAAAAALERLSAAREDAVIRLGQDLAEGPPGLAKVLDDLECPMQRLARVISALCQSDTVSPMSCSSEMSYYRPLQDTLARGAAGSCPAMSQARPLDLEYLPVPFEDIEIPWQSRTSN